MAESVLTPIPDIRSAFTQRVEGEREDWPDRVVPAEFTRDDVREWLGNHGFPNGHGVANANITSPAGGPLFIALKVWYESPDPTFNPGKKFFILDADGEHDGYDVAHEHRIVPMYGFPGGPMADVQPRSKELWPWLEPYGIGHRICGPIAGDINGFKVTEWRLEDGRFGQQVTRIEMAD